MASVLITDAETRAALAVARALGSAGHEVPVVGSDARGLAGGSRHVASTCLLPDPAGQPDAFVAGLADRARDVSAELVVPVTEVSLGCLWTLSPLDFTIVSWWR